MSGLGHTFNDVLDTTPRVFPQLCRLHNPLPGSNLYGADGRRQIRFTGVEREKFDCMGVASLPGGHSPLLLHFLILLGFPETEAQIFRNAGPTIPASVL